MTTRRIKKLINNYYVGIQDAVTKTRVLTVSLWLNTSLSVGVHARARERSCLRVCTYTRMYVCSLTCACERACVRVRACVIVYVRVCACPSACEYIRARTCVTLKSTPSNDESRVPVRHAWSDDAVLPMDVLGQSSWRWLSSSVVLAGQTSINERTLTLPTTETEVNTRYRVQPPINAFIRHKRFPSIC